MSGVLPQRSTSVGTMPNDGTSGEGEWAGTIPTSALPRLFNPARGYITSSNNLVDRQWPGLVTRDWAAPYRTTQLHRLIDAATGVDGAMAAEWQNDVTGLASAGVLAGVDSARALANQRKNTAAGNVLAELKAWDRLIDQRGVVTLYHLFEDAVWRRTFADEMGDELFVQFYDWAGAERPSGLYTLLDDPSSRWFDDIATIDRRETRDDIFVLAAEDASIRYASEFGGRQTWGAAHRAAFTHPMANASFVLGWLFNRGPVSCPGDTYTVNRMSYRRSQPFDVWEVPVVASDR